MMDWLILGKTALFYSIVTIYLGLCPRIISLYNVKLTMKISSIFAAFLDNMNFINFDQFSFSHLDDLRCLFLQNNKLDHIENISSLQNLTTLNLSHNYLSSLCSLACLPMLHTFIVSHNKLCTSKDLEELKA